MAYKNRPGIELIQVCGQDILVATRALWSECPRIRPIPKLWAFYWRLMEQGRTDQGVVGFVADFMKRPREDILTRSQKCFDTLHEEGFLIEVPDEVDEHDGE